MNKIKLTGKNLTLKELHSIASGTAEVFVSSTSEAKIKSQRKKLEAQIKDFPNIPIYGTNRLHGDLKDVPVPNDLIEEYQEKYIKVHNCGTGEPLSIFEVRAIMAIRLNSFLKGHSGISWNTCNILIQMINKGVTPWVLEEGSVGASGDLVPLAMIGAVIIALPEGKAYYKGKLMSAQEALNKAGIKPVRLGAKEAMGLTNGSNFIASLATLTVLEAERLLSHASVSVGLSLEAIRGEKRAFGELINEKSDRHPGQIAIAKQIRNLVKDSMRMTKESQEIQFAHERNKERVQDRYSFRCSPQIHGATFEAIEKLKQTLVIEINSVTDNPVFDFEITNKVNLNGKKVDSISFASGGNFHGQLLASPIDYVKATLTSLSIAIDKRTFSLLDEHLSYGLPGDLALDSSRADAGYMIAQYAGAARVAENRVLSTPASVMSVSTAANQEDMVSMGSVGVLHLKKVVKNLETLIAIELLCATRAIQITEKKLPPKLRKLGIGTSKSFHILSKVLGTHTKGDVYIRTEIEKVREVIKSGVLIK
jgi:histidine ammonia-lyase